MKKRRRAYKKYDWRWHQIWLIYQREFAKLLSAELDNLILYGEKYAEIPTKDA